MLTLTQLAGQLGVCKQLVSRYAAQGRIAGATRFGRAWMFPDDACVQPKAAKFRKLPMDPPPLAKPQDYEDRVAKYIAHGMTDYAARVVVDSEIVLATGGTGQQSKEA